MIICSADFKPKGFGIKKYIKRYHQDIIVVSNKKISRRKQRNIEKYISSLNCDRILNKSHCKINSYGCFSENEVMSAICERIIARQTVLNLNDEKGYAVDAVKKNIKNFASVRIYGNKVYKNMQKEWYVSHGISVIISDTKVKNALDTDAVFNKIRNDRYYNDVVQVTYMDMLMHYGVKILDTAYSNIYN